MSSLQMVWFCSEFCPMKSYRFRNSGAVSNTCFSSSLCCPLPWANTLPFWKRTFGLAFLLIFTNGLSSSNLSSASPWEWYPWLCQWQSITFCLNYWAFPLWNTDVKVTLCWFRTNNPNSPLFSETKTPDNGLIIKCPWNVLPSPRHI